MEDSIMKKKFKLEDLDCANCAANKNIVVCDSQSHTGKARLCQRSAARDHISARNKNAAGKKRSGSTGLKTDAYRAYKKENI